MVRRRLACPTFATACPHSQASPELLKLLGEDSDDGRSLSPFIAPPAATATSKPPSRGTLPAVATARAGKGPGMDTPRGLGEEELTEDELLRLELEKVKAERTVLLHSISVVKSQAGDQ